MLIPTIILGVLAIGLTIWVYTRGGDVTGPLKGAGMQVLTMIPLLFFAMVLAGVVQQVIPQETISGWLGQESGWRGIMIGTVVGGMMPGGPFISLPIAAGLLRVGAGVGTMVAMITGWSLLAFMRLPMEVSIMGWKFTLIRLACTFFFAPIAGWLAAKLFSNVSLVD
jgi:uncharacterized protein